jgi:TrmH family RNA methyltransferase
MITSRDNQVARRARAARDGRERDLIFVEGLRLCEEAAGADLLIEDVLYTEDFWQDQRGRALLEKIGARHARVSLVSDSVLASVSDTRTPQGVALVARRPRTGPDRLAASGQAALIAVLHCVSNPANAGAILRAAEAAGATGAVATLGTTDIFSPKALRGAMGSSFRLPLWTGAPLSEVYRWCAEHGIRTVCADTRARLAHTEINWLAPSAIITGGEGGGLTPQEIAAADVCVRIPMRAPVESLNVAVACAVILYEAARQRDRGGPGG